MVADKIERIYQYRVLMATRDQHQIPLDESSRQRLERLSGQLARGVPQLDDRDPYTLLTVPLPVQFIVGGSFGAGVVHNASADGLAIATEEAPPLGVRVLVHVKEPTHGVEYTFPCRVVARVVKGRRSMGVAFEGMPTQSRVGGRRSGVWRSDATPTEARTKKKSRRQA